MRLTHLFLFSVSASLFSACVIVPPREPLNQTGTGATSLSSSAVVIDETEQEAPKTGESLEVSAETGSAIQVTLTESGTILFTGSGAESTVPVLREFFDYDCEYCREHALFERTWIDAEYVATRKLVIERILVSVTSWGERLAIASLCAFEQGLFEEFDAQLLSTAPRTEAELLLRSKQAGLRQPSFSQCVKRKVFPSVSATFPDGTPVERVPAFSIGKMQWLGVEYADIVRGYLEAETGKNR